MSKSELIDLVKQSQSFHRTNQFRVDFVLPEGLRGDFDTARLSLNCFSAKIPGYSIENFEHEKSGAPKTFHAASIQHGEAQFTFYTSKDFSEFTLFDKWRKLAINDETGKLGYFNDYVSSVHVVPLSNNTRRLMNIELIECKPTTLGETDLSWKSENEISEMTVSMSYTRYIPTIN